MTTTKTVETVAPAVTAPGLIARLAAVMGDLPDVKPGGTNAYFKYKFIESNQILGLLRPRLAKANIMVISDVVSEDMQPMATARGGTSNLTKLTVLFTVVDGYTGETISGHGIGYGDDSGDKGANKAFTAAMKNWLIKLFLIGGESDIEDDAATDKRASERESGLRPYAIPEKAPVVTASKVRDVKPGGKTSGANALQVREVGRLSRELNLGAVGTAQLIETLFGVVMELPDDETAQNMFLTKFLGEMAADDIGSLIASMNEMKTQQDDEYAELLAGGPEDEGAK